jgi:hypothetical protein
MRARSKLIGVMGWGVMAIGVMAGCATALPIVRLQPHGSDVVWVSGRAVVTSARDGIRVAAAFDHQDREAIAFRVEIANDTAERFDVDPRDMHFAVCVSDPNCSGKRNVIDPEQKLLALDHARSREEADGKNMVVAGTTLLFLGVAADVADVASSGRSSAPVGNRAMLASLSVDNSAAQSDRRLGSIDAHRSVWSASAFRRTTLLPGHGAAGLVYVPLKPNAKYVRLELNVAGLAFVFPFEQMVTAPPGAPYGTSTGTSIPPAG